MTSTKGATERDGMIIGGGDGGERIEERNRRRWRTERLMGNEGSRQRERERESPLRRQRRSRRSKRGGGGGRGGRGRWLPWLPETAVAATDDARGVTDSWQSYRAPTRTGCASTYADLYTHPSTTDRYV